MAYGTLRFNTAFTKDLLIAECVSLRSNLILAYLRSCLSRGLFPVYLPGNFFNALLNFPLSIVWFTSSLAETNRTPFDLNLLEAGGLKFQGIIIIIIIIIIENRKVNVKTFDETKYERSQKQKNL